MLQNVAGALCLALFIVAQTFQEIASRTYLPSVDRVRAGLILGTIVLLIVPFVVIVLRWENTEPNWSSSNPLHLRRSRQDLTGAQSCSKRLAAN
jgi:hypothetical protein